MAITRALVGQEDIRKRVAMLSTRDDHCTVSSHDAAFWVKGCSSLGLWRAAVLVDVIHTTRKGKQRRSRCLLDVKQAVDASAPWAPGTVAPDGEPAFTASVASAAGAADAVDEAAPPG